MCKEHSKTSDPAVGSTRLVRRFRFVFALITGLIQQERTNNELEDAIRRGENTVNAVLSLPCREFLLALQNPSTLSLVAKTPRRIARYYTMLRRWQDSGQPDPEALLQPYHPGIWQMSYYATLDHLCSYFEVRHALGHSPNK
jgi:hypothetical protein